MSGFLIRKERNGLTQEMEVTSHGMMKLLADPRVLGDLLFELTPGKILPIQLKDGPARIQRTPLRLSQQQHLQLPQPDLPQKPYQAHVQLKFLLPAMVRCSGHSADHVRETIRDVVHGQCGMPREFQFQIRPEDISAMIGKMEVGDVTAIDDVEVTSVAPFYLLTDAQER